MLAWLTSIYIRNTLAGLCSEGYRHKSLNIKHVAFLSQITAAAKRGAIGAILYVDPAAVSKEGTGSHQTYPYTAWMSKKAVFSKKISQRNGDMLTPHIPAITGMYRKSINETELPSIPVQPISYEDALKLLSRLRGEFA